MNNSEKLSLQQESPPSSTSLKFISTTEFVELPSKGLCYSEKHPLYNVDKIEIGMITAAEEDILANESYIENGVVAEKFLGSIIANKNIDPLTLLNGDQNAIFLQSRISAYGSEYETKFQCPSCNETNDYVFNLDANIGRNNIDEIEKLYENVSFDPPYLFITLPKTSWNVKCKFLTSEDDKRLKKMQTNKKKIAKGLDNPITDVMRLFVVSINDVVELGQLAVAIRSLPASDSHYLRKVYRHYTPNVEMVGDFVCSECKYHDESIKIPIGINFFWPDR